MAQTVTECLAAGTDSVNLIDGVKAGTWNVEGMTQTEINEMVQMICQMLKEQQIVKRLLMLQLLLLVKNTSLIIVNYVR